jgi:hypothetical protein
MSRREPIVKATISALQPKGLDLSKYQKTRERQVNLRPEDASGALAFAACDVEVDGEVMRGDTLRPRLLRLKASPSSGAFFQEALHDFLHRHGFKRTRPVPMLYATGLVALFEWMYDACPKCRKDRRGAPKPRLCLDCGQRNVKVQRRQADGSVRDETIVEGQPTAGCGKCHGLGRIFPKDDAPRGMVCVTCQNSGRLAFKGSVRRSLVDEMHRDMMGRPMDHDAWSRVWIKRYWQLLDDLRSIDEIIAGNMNVRLFAGTGTQLPGPRFEEESDG